MNYGDRSQRSSLASRKNNSAIASAVSIGRSSTFSPSREKRKRLSGNNGSCTVSHPFFQKSGIAEEALAMARESTTIEETNNAEPTESDSADMPNLIVNKRSRQPVAPTRKVHRTHKSGSTAAPAVHFPHVQPEVPIITWQRKKSVHVQTDRDAMSKQKFSNATAVVDTRASGTFNNASEAVAEDETVRNKRRGTESNRRIDVKLLATLLWSFLTLMFPGRWKATAATALVDAVHDVLGVEHPKEFLPALAKKSTQFLRRRMCKPWKCMKEIDMHGRFSLQALNGIGEGVEDVPKNGSHCTPHAGTVGKTGRKLELWGATDLHFKLNECDTDHGACHWFDNDILMRMLLQACDLERFAASDDPKVAVFVAVSGDGALLTPNLSHFTVGVKIADPRAKDPNSGDPLCMTDEFQSRNHCHPFQMCFAHESKALVHDNCSDFYEHMLNLETPGLPVLKNFIVSCEQDMKFTWEIIGLGGGSHTKEQSCCCCEVNKDCLESWFSGDFRCKLCKDYNLVRCCCQPMSTREFPQEKQERINKCVEDTLDCGCKKLSQIADKTKIIASPKLANRHRQIKHIEFQYTNDDEEEEFRLLLERELTLRVRDDRKILSSMMKLSIEEKRHELKKLLDKESQMWVAKNAIERRNKAQAIAANVAAETCMPCVLHAENRASEAIFYNLLAQRMNDCKDGDTHTRSECIKAVTAAMNEAVSGDPETGRLGSWTFPFKPAKKEVLKRTMTNETARGCVFGVKTVASLMHSEEYDEAEVLSQVGGKKNEKRLELWHELADQWRIVTMFFRQHSKFDKRGRDLKQFHMASNKFVDAWVQLGMKATNYIHMIGAGHFCHFAEKCRSLHRHSQQGWEALNQKITKFFHVNTNKGGQRGTNVGKRESNKAPLDVARMTHRWTMWRLGLGDAFFNPLPMQDVEAPGGAVMTEEGEEPAEDEPMEAAAGEEGQGIACDEDGEQVGIRI